MCNICIKLEIHFAYTLFLPTSKRLILLTSKYILSAGQGNNNRTRNHTHFNNHIPNNHHELPQKKKIKKKTTTQGKPLPRGSEIFLKKIQNLTKKGVNQSYKLFNTRDPMSSEKSNTRPRNTGFILPGIVKFLLSFICKAVLHTLLEAKNLLKLYSKKVAAD